MKLWDLCQRNSITQEWILEEGKSLAQNVENRIYFLKILMNIKENEDIQFGKQFALVE